MVNLKKENKMHAVDLKKHVKVDLRKTEKRIGKVVSLQKATVKM